MFKATTLKIFFKKVLFYKYFYSYIKKSMLVKETYRNYITKETYENYLAKAYKNLLKYKYSVNTLFYEGRKKLDVYIFLLMTKT